MSLFLVILSYGFGKQFALCRFTLLLMTYIAELSEQVTRLKDSAAAAQYWVNSRCTIPTIESELKCAHFRSVELTFDSCD